MSESRYPTQDEIAQQGTAAFCELVEGEGFCADANGNGWPDAVDMGLGTDPTVNECLESDCAGVDLEDFEASVQANTLFILDASGSMAGDAGGGQTKMVAAKEALVGYVQATPDYADLGLMVYGHRGDNSDAGKPESCAGIETFAPVGAFTPETAESVVSQFEATGWTPIAASLAAAGPVLQAAAAEDAGEGLEGVTNRIILISDGIETCEGDPVASAQALVDLGIEVVVDVIGFDVEEADRAALQAVAETTGGVYQDASGAAGLNDVLDAYADQRSAALDSLACQLTAIKNNSVCNLSYSSEATEYIYGLADDAEAAGDEDMASFLKALVPVMQDEAYEVSAAQDAELRKTLEQLAADFEDAQARAGGAAPNKRVKRDVVGDPRCRFSTQVRSSDEHPSIV